MQRKMITFVLAGGMGSRLLPLTRDRAKPAISFGGKYRIIDFVLSNLANSGIHSIYVLVQFNSQPLLRHLRHGRIRSYPGPAISSRHRDRYRRGRTPARNCGSGR